MFLKLFGMNEAALMRGRRRVGKGSARSDNALYSAGADAEFAGNLQDAVAFGAEPLDTLLDRGGGFTGNAYMLPTLRENMMSDGWAVEVKMKVLGGGESKQTYYACVPDKLGAEDAVRKRINATDHVIVTARNLVLASVFEAMNVKLGDVSQWDIMGYDAQRPQGASKVDRGLYFPLSLGSLTGRCREVLTAVGLPSG